MTRISARAIVLAALLVAPGTAQNLSDAKIVFVGTIRSVNAVTFADVPTSPRTAVVHVDSVVLKPRALSLFKAGDEVTLELREGAPAEPGTRARFYAVSWIAGGEGQLALREIGREAAGPQESTAPADAARALSDRQLLARAERAEVVVVGRVVSISDVPVPERAAAGAPTHISEHDPHWKQAAIRVTSAIKGATANQTVTIRFPASDDVAWRDAPKLRVGQSGTFVLDKPPQTAAFETTGAYTATSRDQVLSATAGQRLQQLLRPR